MNKMKLPALLLSGVLAAGSLTLQPGVLMAQESRAASPYDQYFSNLQDLFTTQTSGASISASLSKNQIVTLNVSGTLPQVNDAYPLEISINNPANWTLQDVEIPEGFAISEITGKTQAQIQISDTREGSFDFSVMTFADNNEGYLSYGVYVDLDDVAFEGLTKPGVNIIPSSDLKSATVSVSESGTSYQWQKAEVLLNESETVGVAQIIKPFADIPGATAATYTADGLGQGESGPEVQALQGFQYRCLITKDGKITYSNDALLPLQNEWITINNPQGDYADYTVSFSDIQAIAKQDNPYEQQLTFARQLGIKSKYYIDYPAGYAEEGYPGIFFTPDYGFDSDVETKAWDGQTIVTIFERIKKPGIYHIVAEITPTGIYSGLSKKIALKVVDNNTDVPDESFPAPSFSDVPQGDWFTEWVEKAAQMGLVVGSNGYFRPSDPITRGQLALILYRLAGEPAYSGDKSFTDITDPQTYYYNAVLWAASNGVVTGYTTGQYAGYFMPSVSVTRQELVTMLSRYAQNVAKLSVSQGSDISSYPDYSQVSEYARQPFSWAAGSKIINGKEIDKVFYLAPLATANRAEAAKMLVSFADLLVNDNVPIE